MTLIGFFEVLSSESYLLGTLSTRKLTMTSAYQKRHTGGHKRSSGSSIRISKSRSKRLLVSSLEYLSVSIFEKNNDILHSPWVTEVQLTIGLEAARSQRILYQIPFIIYQRLLMTFCEKKNSKRREVS